ncbi:HAD hydrolase-like protein [Faecalibacillus intestinalis]
MIFDLDGTLLNTDLLIKKSFIHTFKKYNQVIL